MYATSRDYDDDHGYYLVELVVVDELIFHCYSGPNWRISTTCELSNKNHSCKLNDIFVNAHELGSVNITNYGSVHSYYNNKIGSLPLMFFLWGFSNTYSSNHGTGRLQKHQLDDKWDGIANTIREQLY